MAKQVLSVPYVAFISIKPAFVANRPVASQTHQQQRSKNVLFILQITMATDRIL